MTRLQAVELLADVVDSKPRDWRNSTPPQLVLSCDSPAYQPPGAVEASFEEAPVLCADLSLRHSVSLEKFREQQGRLWYHKRCGLVQPYGAEYGNGILLTVEEDREILEPQQQLDVVVVLAAVLPRRVECEMEVEEVAAPTRQKVVD